MSYETLNPGEAKQRLDAGEGWTYLDVRSEQEFAAGHAPGAYNIPLLFAGAGGMQPNPDFVEQVERHFPKQARLVVACKAGGRSRRACELLSAQGYSSLANMDGGFHGRQDEDGVVVVEGWAPRGLPTTTTPEPGHAFDELKG